MSFIDIYDSDDKKHKYYALFEDEDGEFKVYFGAKGYEDYTIHKDRKRKESYMKRHETREDWENPYSAGALSRWILWNKPSFEASLKDYKKHFGFE